MKKISLIFIVALSFATLLTSCKKNHNVPAFPEELTNYFPYNEGESFSFVSEDNDTLTFVSNKASLSLDNSHTQPFFSLVSCAGDDFAYMHMNTNETTVPYWDDKKIVLEFRMIACQTSPKTEGFLSIDFTVSNNDNGVVHISYGNNFDCNPYDGNVNMVIGDEIILHDNMHPESLGLTTKVKWNEGIVSFDFDGKKWNAVKQSAKKS